MSRFVPPLLAILATSLPGCSGDANLLGDEGLRKCEAGRNLIALTEPLSNRSDLDPDERPRLRADLEAGTALIIEGLFLLDECVQRSGRTFDHRSSEEALKTARYRLWKLDK